MRRFYFYVCVGLTFLSLWSTKSFAQVDFFNDLVAWYPMTGDAKCAIGTGMDASVVNNATLTTDRFGHDNSAYAFDGQSKLLANINYSGFTAISYSAWIKTSERSKYEVFIQTPYNFVGYVNRFTPGHFMSAFDANSWNNATDNESSTDVATGDWFFVSASNDGNTTRIYVNGVLEKSYQEQLITSIGQLAIGGGVDNATTLFVGSVDEVRLYKRKLSDDDMMALFNASSVDTTALAVVKIFDNLSNPASRIYQIDATKLPTNSMANIIDINGKLVLQRPLNGNKQTFNLTPQKPGIYVIQIYDGTALKSRKIALQ